MIKIGTFEFEELESKNHWADFAVFGECTYDKVEYFDKNSDVALRLDPEECWQVSMDQSTSNSGIFIKNYTNTKAYMIEVSRHKDDQADDYVFNLEMFLHMILEGCKVSHLIYERPIKTENYRSAQVLFQLEGMLRQLVRRYPEFKTAQLDHIENAAWRSVVIDSAMFGSLPRKKQSEEAIEYTFPWTKGYLGSIGKDLDIYEALGVMFGWFFSSFDKFGRPYVRGDKYVGNIGGFIMPFQGAEEVAAAFKEQGIDAFWQVENPRKSIYENIASGIEHYKIKCVEISDPVAMLALTVECNLKWLSPDKMTVILVAANYVDKRMFEITGEAYQFVF